MRDVTKYSEFDHKKVMSILLDLKRRVNSKNKIKGSYQIIIETYEEDLVQKNIDWLNDAGDDDDFTFVLCRFSFWYYTEHDVMTKVFYFEMYENGKFLADFNNHEKFFSTHITSNNKKNSSALKWIFNHLSKDSDMIFSDHLEEDESIYDLLGNIVQTVHFLTKI